jgi:hypothetical protein
VNYVNFFDLVELLFGRFELAVALLIEEISKFICLFKDVESSLESCVLELDDEVNEDFVFVLREGKLLANTPKLFSHPVGYGGDISQIVHVASNITNLFTEHS